MNLVKRLKIYNILSYVIFLVNVYCYKHSPHGWEIVTAFLPYIMVILTTCELNFKFDPLLKYVLQFSIPDFIIRLAAMFVAYGSTQFYDNDHIFKLLILVIIVLLAFNMILEKLMEVKFLKLESKRTYRELSTIEVMNNNSEGVVILEAFSSIETIVLFIIIVMVIGFPKNLGIWPTIIYFIILSITTFLYMLATIKTLIEYYKDKQVAKKIFLHENIGVILMIIFASTYGYLFGYNDFKDFIIYLILGTSTLPRYFSRRKRLKEVYQNHMIEKIEK